MTLFRNGSYPNLQRRAEIKVVKLVETSPGLPDNAWGKVFSIAFWVQLNLTSPALFLPALASTCAHPAHLPTHPPVKSLEWVAILFDFASPSRTVKNYPSGAIKNRNKTFFACCQWASLKGNLQNFQCTVLGWRVVLCPGNTTQTFSVSPTLPSPQLPIFNPEFSLYFLIWLI